MNKQQIIIISSMLLGLTACSSTPEPNIALDTARSQYAAAAANPYIQQHAPLDLEKAKEQLAKAEQLHQEDEDREIVDHHAYMAKQRVAIAQEKAKLKQSEEIIEAAAVERTETLLQAKSRELEQLKQELAGRETARGLILTLGDILFDTGEAQLKPGAIRSIQKLATYLQANPSRTIAVEGFTDSRGSEQYNRQLAQARADAVKFALVNAGVAPNRIVVAAYGEAYPVADNSTAAGRQQNRRVEIVVSDERGIIPPLAARP